MPWRIPSWTTLVRIGAVILLGLAWGRTLSPLVVAVVTAFLAGAVLSVVHHAEVVAHRVGEPFGSLVLAVAVTVIEVALINAEGTGAALATVTTLATLVSSFPASRQAVRVRSSRPQLAFAAITAFALYALFVALQTGRHRDYFTPVSVDGTVVTDVAVLTVVPGRATLLQAVFISHCSPRTCSSRSVRETEAAVGIDYFTLYDQYHFFSPNEITGIRSGQEQKRLHHLPQHPLAENGSGGRLVDTASCHA